MAFRIFCITVVLFALYLTGCVLTNPAGTADYVNPVFADEQKGFFYCGSGPYSAVFVPNTAVVWISEPGNGRIWYKDVSKAVVNPDICDTLVVDFAPGLMVAPPDGSVIYVSHYNSNDVYLVDTETLKWKLVYTCSSSIKTMQLSSDGGIMYLGSLGTPWHIESVSTSNWSRSAIVTTEWPVLRMKLSPDNSLLAAGNSGRTDIYMYNAVDLSPVDTLFMPMRTGTMAFSSDSRSLVVLDAASNRPFMVKVDLATGGEEFRSRPYNSYLVCSQVPGTKTLILPRNQDERVSILNMDNMTFAPSLLVDSRIGAVCCSDNGDYIVTVSRTTVPGRATVFIKGE